VVIPTVDEIVTNLLEAAAALEEHAVVDRRLSGRIAIACRRIAAAPDDAFEEVAAAEVHAIGELVVETSEGGDERARVDELVAETRRVRLSELDERRIHQAGEAIDRAAAELRTARASLELQQAELAHALHLRRARQREVAST
jgi:hypothetical protein